MSTSSGLRDAPERGSSPESGVPRYPLSRDYSKLYSLICRGFRAAAFVDYVLNDQQVARDICSVRRRDAFQISIAARGIEYGGIFRFQQSDGIGEADLFCKHCEAINLEWIDCASHG